MEKLIQIANNLILNTDSQTSVVSSEEFCLPPTYRGDEVPHGLFVDGWPTYWSLDQIRKGYRNSNVSLAARFGTRLDGKLSLLGYLSSPIIFIFGTNSGIICIYPNVR